MIEALLVHYTVGVFVLVFLSSQLERPSLLFFCRTFGDWSIPDNTLSSSLTLLDLHMDILGAVGSFFFFFCLAHMEAFVSCHVFIGYSELLCTICTSM